MSTRYFVAALAIVTGCAEPPDGRFGCTTDQDCPTDWYCRNDPSEPELRCWATPGGEDGGHDDGGMDDAGRAQVDAGMDAGMSDGGMTDGGMDAGMDGGMSDGGMDAGMDGGMDAGMDAGNICSPNPCMNGGTCSTVGTMCACTPGFSGTLCEIDDPCVPSPCMNGGACSAVGGSAMCACSGGFGGAFCEIPPNPCVPNPCLNGGTCSGAGVCDCPGGFNGARCEIVEGDDCIDADHTFHSRIADAPSLSFPGSVTFTVTASGSGRIRELYFGIGNFGSGSTYTVTLAVGTDRVVRYPSLMFDARSERGSPTDPGNPLRNTARAILPTAFAIVDGNPLTITIEGSGGDLHRFGDGGVRAVIVGERLPCGFQNCVDGAGTFTCTGPTDPCRIDLCLSGGRCDVVGGAAVCTCPPEFTGQYCSDRNDCVGVTCATGYTCADSRDAFVCSCAGPSCLDGDECALGPAPLLYRRSEDAPSFSFPGSVSFQVTITTSGSIQRVHMGLGSFSSSTTYNLTLASSGGTTRMYPSITFGPHNVHPHDPSNTNPLHNMATVNLPAPFPVVAGERLTVTATGSGGTMHQFGDGTLRMTLVGVGGPSCPASHACSDGTRQYTCRLP
jgi:hypothetical protein